MTKTSAQVGSGPIEQRPASHIFKILIKYISVTFQEPAHYILHHKFLVIYNIMTETTAQVGSGHHPLEQFLLLAKSTKGAAMVALIKQVRQKEKNVEL